MIFAPFWSENGYGLCPFYSGIGYGFRGNYGSVWTYLSFQFQMNKKEREKWNSEWIWRNHVWNCSNLINADIISLRRGLKIDVKSGQDLAKRAKHPHQEFPRVPPPPGLINNYSSSPNELWINSPWGRMGYWLRGHEGETNNCFCKIQLVGQKYGEYKTFSRQKARPFRYLGYKI